MQLLYFFLKKNSSMVFTRYNFKNITHLKKQKGHCLSLWSTRDPIRSPRVLGRKNFLSGKILKWCQTVPFTLVLSKQFWQVQVCSTCIFKKKVIISLQKCFEMTLISVKYFFFRFRSTEYLNQCIILRVGFFFKRKFWMSSKMFRNDPHLSKIFFFRFRSTEYLNQCIILRVGFFFQKKFWKFWMSFCWFLKS